MKRNTDQVYGNSLLGLSLCTPIFTYFSFTTAIPITTMMMMMMMMIMMMRMTIIVIIALLMVLQKNR